MAQMLLPLLLGAAHAFSPRASAPRAVRVVGKHWVNATTGEPLLLKGPNVVVKGSPWLPRVEGRTVCNDTAHATCETFNEADAVHITRTMGWNAIRLGVAWPGAQPADAPALDAAFVANLRAILRLCEAHGIHVILDMHGDMVGSANCGWGVPMWLSQQAAPQLIGKPLRTALPYSLLAPFTDEFKIQTSCGDNESRWAEHAADPDYNLLNGCCAELNGEANHPAVGFSTLAQETMGYLLREGKGRDAFVRYWRLLAEAVADYPAAVGFELINEPMSLERGAMFETWEAVNDAVVEVVPDMSVGVMDLGEGAVLPWWFAKVDPGIDIPWSAKEWLKRSSNLFYAWHWYGDPKDPAEAVKTVLTLQDEWNISSMLTETMSCDAIKAAESAGISWSYWHYSQYCNTATAYGGKLPPNNFGACILGWGGGTSSKVC